jgi:hypothetical protein
VNVAIAQLTTPCEQPRLKVRRRDHRLRRKPEGASDHRPFTLNLCGTRYQCGDRVGVAAARPPAVGLRGSSGGTGWRQPTTTRRPTRASARRSRTELDVVTQRPNLAQTL